MPVEQLVPREGWVVLHLFWKLGPRSDVEAITAAVKAAEGAGVQVVTFAVLGHKADLGSMLLGPDIVTLRQAQSTLALAGLELATSYVSLTEVSEYARGMPPERLEPRLHPQLPPDGMRALCFYPMSKRREATDNWYQLDYEARLSLMREHGASGHRFAGRVLQLVTGSTGLDDYEWGVTLFACTPDDLKECVHAMRFDEASARYADFGPFYTGVVASVEDVLGLCGAS
ncbi:MAG: chlorite dismutase family protein [Acidimicrobiales bacterium]|jgi:chlorite dismutase